MLQPRGWLLRSAVILLLIVDTIQGINYVDGLHRQRRENDKDITTVLLVDNHGKSSLGRYLSVKPDLGLITSTARTFIQDGVTTEYATQVLGTTLDNGRLYAHLLTKTSRVVYDHDSQTKVHDPYTPKHWNLDESQIFDKNFVKNTDFISPATSQAVHVTPTSLFKSEILNEAPSNNARLPFGQKKMLVKPQEEVAVVKSENDLTHENLIIHNDNPVGGVLRPSKVKEWDNLPTFTVRNEFSPSGFSSVENSHDFETKTERSKLSTPADRQARLLFKAGLIKPTPKDLQTVTYTGFADFTTTVANTVIVFTPHTSEIPKQVIQSTKSSVAASIRPTSVHRLPQVTKSITTTTEKQFPTFLTTEEVPTTTPATTTTSSIEDQEEEEVNEENDNFSTPGINTMVINKEDRDGKHQSPDEPIDLDAKFSVLANEQKQNDNTVDQSVTYTKDIIQPSETQAVMLSTPNSDDIARIIASLQAAQATQPLQMTTQTTEVSSTEEVVTPSIKTVGGATTIFFEDDDFSFEPTTSSSKLLLTTATTTTEQMPITEQDQETTTEFELTTFPETTLNEIEDESELECTGEWKVVPTTVFKTLTYLTTYFIPLESSTSTSIKSNVVVTDQVSSQTIQCKPSKIFETTTELSSAPVTEPITTTEKEALTTTEEQSEITTTIENKPNNEPDLEFTTQTEEITTERRHVTESEPETTDVTTENGEEVELIFKTLYTTYTYLTTYFQDSTSSVASRIVVNTNVITSTLEPGTESSDAAVEGLLVDEERIIPSRAVSFEDLADIQPTVLTRNDVSSSDDENGANTATATPALDDKLLQTANGIKTFYTTYTYFTTIFVDGETEISSRTEVYTNYVTPTAPIEVLSTKLNEEELLENRLRSLKLNSESSINRQQDEENYILPSNTKHNSDYVTLNRGAFKPEIDNDIIDLSEYETIATMVTDVRSSTSKGEERIIDNIDKRNILLDDQIVSESNNESEILPSPPTLLLQTSYTTFTYFTTKYHGTTSSDIVSRLETVTNVVTSTLTPTQSLSTEDMSLPVTYFTTFTYWTTLYKDGQTKITSREETISNVVTPGFTSTEPHEAIIPLITPTVQPHDDIKPTETLKTSLVPSTVGDDQLTTYYTTYTYYTTSYIGDDTVLNSRLETVTNVLNNTSPQSDDNQVGRAVSEGDQNKIDETNIKPTGLLSSIISTVDSNGTSTVFSTDVYGTYIKGLYAKVLESTSSILNTLNSTATEIPKENLKPTGVVSINQGKIVDADGISTLLYTTQAVGTYVDGSYAEVIESTSSLVVDSEKKAALGSNVPVAHRTGLVRSIDGSIIQNKTTTLYQSKVLGTVIDGRYAQIIESTSSFILPTITPSAVIPEVLVTATKLANNLEATSEITPTPVVVESSISDTTTKSDEESNNENDEEEDEDSDKDDGRNKSRLSFQSKKRTFTPAIRPFASRQRPTFAPKRSKTGATTAATITRSDFTPTVTAIPASKANRFGGRRSSSTGNIQSTVSGNKRFSRPKATRSSNIQAKVTSSGFRRGSVTRSSSAIRPSSLFGGGNSRFRIRPTAASGLSRSPSSKIVTETPPDSENDLTTNITEESPTDSSGEAGDTTVPLQTTTESARSRNPLLRFRRPPVTRGSQVIRTTPKPRTTKATTTTSRPKTSPARPNSLLNRQRAGGLFPRRNLFTTTTTTASPPEEELSEEEVDEEAIEEGNEEEDVDYESSLQLTRTETAPTTPKPTKPYSGIQIRPFKRRSKRQAIYSRFKRPGIRSTTAAPSTTEIEYVDVSSSKPSFRNRYQGIRYRSGKSQQQQSTTTTTTQAPQRKQRISPTKPQSGTRAQFTLREKDTISRSFQPRNGSVRRTTTSAPRSNSRIRSGFSPDSSSRRTTANPRNSRSRGRVTSRGRTFDQNVDDNFVVPKFDGTITVTYKIPTEVTIPVVNGKITEYKNVVTAKLSTEVLSPNQYSTTVNPLGKEVKILVTENSSVNDNGATLITQYLLNETPTTSVIFTPTQIRGRQTSFSHVIPSTAYQVEEVVNTIQPALAAQAPLANILLSQLLLGGGVPTNPLLALQNNAGVPATPTTEFKTRTTTYVTTVTSTLHTVLPLTFRGKEILTTISDTSTQVVTATEYFTDTVVVTPTLFGQAPQLNTLLLPLLQQQLQQQQLQQQQLQQANQLLQPQIPANVYKLAEPQAQQTFINSAENLEESNLADEEEIVTSPRSAEITDAPKRKPKKTTSKRKPTKVTPPKETSVITLYVSGRTPGEFTTVLSTVTVGEDARRKRSVDYVPVKPSRSLEDLLVESSTIDRYVEPASKVLDEMFDVSSKETESLESIIGDVPKHMRTKTPSLFNDKPSIVTKKYSINLKDLSSNPAPDDAKVETFTPRGYVNKATTNQIVHVSKKIGVNSKNSGRTKRDSDNLSENGRDSIQTKRRVRKKLIRRQPVTTTPSANVTEVHRKRRRKIKIKKKKRLLPSQNDNVTTSYLNGLELDGLQATKPRRKLVITRKRVLPNKEKTIDVTPVLPSATTIQMSSTNISSELQYEKNQIAEHFRESLMNNLNTQDNIESYTIKNEMPDENSTEAADENDDEYEDDYYDEDEEGDDEEEYDEEMYDSEGDEEIEAEAENEEILPESGESSTLLSDHQSLPAYEPFFPELTETTDVPVLLLKTTVLSTVELDIKTLTATKLRTYTFVVTTVAGNEEIVTSTTEIRPQIKTTTVTESLTSYTTLTLLDLDKTDVQPTFLPTLDYNPSSLSNTEDNPSMREEPRNLATRVMSNGVEVIVAGGKTTYPGDKDFKRILSTSQKHVTLKPSTVSDHMLLMLPQETSNMENPLSLDPNQFVVKTCLTTFTYLTTFLEKGTTTVSSHEQVVSNVATEERMNTGKILPTPAMGVTLTQYPTFSVGVFHTTYTYLNTILDGEQPLIISSQHVVANTVTAPDDYLSLLKPSEVQEAVKDTNTYISTIDLEKTLYEGNSESVISTRDVVTQVVITESVPPRARPVTTSYTALDETEQKQIMTTDVTKTYFVTYTYYNTLTKDGVPTIYTNISVESDIVTEKVILPTKITTTETSKFGMSSLAPKFNIFATRIYYTTFTYFTTLMKENDPKSTTIINSRTKVIQNTVTETLEPSLFDASYLNSLQNDLISGSGIVQKIATLPNGEKIEITVQANHDQNEIAPTKVLPIEKTSMVTTIDTPTSVEGSFSTSKANVVTGSTIVFVDDDPFANLTPTPSLESTPTTSSQNTFSSLLASKVVKETKVDVVTSKVKRANHKNKSKNKEKVSPSKVVNNIQQTFTSVSQANNNLKNKNVPVTAPPPTDLLGLGSINIDPLQALTPVLNAMAGYIDKIRRSDTINVTNEQRHKETQSDKKDHPPPTADIQNRAPVYIPVGEDFEIAESQNIATFDWTGPFRANKQEAPLLGNNGIPISPGDIITANSDVIVGKPGRVPPRLPSAIPLHPDNPNEIPLGMKPPPLPYEQDQVPAQSNQVIHAPNKDDYVGPPPPLLKNKESFRGEKRKHIPLVPPMSFPTNIEKNIHRGQQKKHAFDLGHQLHQKPHIYRYSSEPEKSSDQQPLIISSVPIVLPEVVERNTGQPLLVQLQPSQVAFVNIPFNRTTALIYGGSTETHHNGQYFDDPSPYPEPEFNPMGNFNNEMSPQVSFHQETPQLNSINQKQVSGVIKVGPYVDHSKEDSDVSPNEKVVVNVEPTRFGLSSENQLKPPPLSFGMSSQDGEVNLHMINHNSGMVHMPSGLLNNNNNNRYNKSNNINIRTPVPLKDEVFPPNRNHYENQHLPNPHLSRRPNKPQYALKTNSERRRPRPNKPKLHISEFMTAPPPSSNHQYGKKQPPKNPLSIPITTDFESSKTPSFQQSANKYHVNNEFKEMIRDDWFVDQHQEDDLANEDGEVIQESNARPLRPGEVPIEILRQSTWPPTSTSTEPNVHNMVRFPDSYSNSTQIRFPYSQLDLKPPRQNSEVVFNYDTNYFNFSPEETGSGTESKDISIMKDQKQQEAHQYTTTAITTSTMVTFRGTTTESVKKMITTEKPVTISLGGNEKYNNITVKKSPYNNNRPKVTSLPIDFSSYSPVFSTESTRYTPSEIVVLNSGENFAIDSLNLTKQINAMEVLQPPPLSVDAFEPPNVLMEPPKIDIIAGDKEIPQAKDVPRPSEEMIPPEPSTEIVFGMSPPPLISTNRPPTTISVSGNDFAIDINRLKVPEVTPISRRPPLRTGYRRTTTSTTRRPTTTKPTHFTSARPLKTKNPVTTSISPTPSLRNTPPMEMIVGETHINFNNHSQEFKPTDKVTTESVTKPDTVTKPIHHAGNEIKVVDDIKPNTSVSDTARPTPTLPTRYITHTKTLTVTITKTTVLKTFGGPPSTMTILVTKTEKSYIVDTVTEFHTLIKPTSIIETITTTVEKSVIQSSSIPSSSILKLKPSSVVTLTLPKPTVVISTDPVDQDESEDNLKDFIINDDDEKIPPKSVYDSQDTMFVVMNDNNKGAVVKIPPQLPASVDESNEIPHRDEVYDSDASNILLAGIFTGDQPNNEVTENKDKCNPDCKPSRNELCQKVEGLMRCVCRPGFARMFPDRPCNPTYTYSLNITIDKIGKVSLKFSNKLKNESTAEFMHLAKKVHEALDRTVMQSDLRDIFHGVHVTSFNPTTKRIPGHGKSGVISNFYLQLSDEINENRIEEIFKKYLRTSNYSLGGTDVYASSSLDNLKVEDFNECENPKFHDCSENAQCLNQKGTYGCSCKEGYSDISENMHYAGRICSADQVGCEKCHYHGTCYTRGSEDVLCQCFHWYAGDRCQINLKVLLIALITLGTILFGLLLVCIILVCARKNTKSGVSGTIGFLPQRIGGEDGTLDRRAMIEDTSSEDSRSETNSAPPYVQQNLQKQLKLKPPPPKGALKKVSLNSVEHSEPGVIFPDQKDRSLTVMIPRAKYHPAPPTPNLTNYTTFDARKPNVPVVSPESKLLSYLDAGPNPSRVEQKRKPSTAVSEQFIEEQISSRKTSGALISAGFEVSATVVNHMGTLGTTCGTEADRSENATLIQKISADLLSRADTSSQINTLRKSLDDDDLESTSNWMDIPRISVVSESRSYDETTIPPPMKSFTRSEYDTKSLHQNDEANTMAERDLGSTFLLPHTHLYKPDRGSDISGFESL